MKNKIFITLLLTLIIGLKHTQAQFYNQGSEVTIQSGATVTVEGDFYNKAGSDFKNSGTLAIKNYVTNDQVMTNDFGGYWIFNGTSTVKIGGNEMIWMNTLNINNPGGFLLQNSLRISKQMEFANGIMKAENIGNVVIFTKNGVIGSPAPTDASFIDGEVIKEGENQTFIFPVGEGTKYQPIQVAFEDNGNDNGLLANYIPTDAGAAPFGGNGSEATLLNNYNSKEYWDLIPVNAGVTKGKVTVFWDGYRDVLPDAVNLRRVAHLSSITSKWENEGTNTGTGTTTSGSVQSNIVSAWSPFTLGTVAAIPLPIRLVSFSGKKVGQINQLNWQTSTEINASHFEIERSSRHASGGAISNEKFEKIGIVNANKAENYQFNDNSSLISHHSSLIFYRLKLVDLDGQFAYSKIIYLENTDNDQIVGNFYPNPAIANQSNIDINLSEKGSWTISTIDLLGKVLKTESRILEKGLNTLQFQNFQKGLNIIQFESNGKMVVRKLIR